MIASLTSERAYFCAETIGRPAWLVRASWWATPHHQRAYPVKNVHVVSTHAGHRVRHWLVRTLPRGRPRTLRLKLNVPTTARGSYCITTRAGARHTRSTAVRYCAAVLTAPPHGLG